MRSPRRLRQALSRVLAGEPAADQQQHRHKRGNPRIEPNAEGDGIECQQDAEIHDDCWYVFIHRRVPPTCRIASRRRDGMALLVNCFAEIGIRGNMRGFALHEGRRDL